MKRHIRFAFGLTFTNRSYYEKRVFTILLAAFLFLTSLGSAIAVKFETKEIPAEEEIMQYALDFMRESQGNEAIGITDFIPMHGIEHERTGYYVTFSNQDKDAGYLIISLLTEGCPVVELAFDGSGPIMELQNDLQTVQTADEYLYTGPDGLFVPTSSDSFYSLYERAEVSEKEAAISAIEYQASIENRAGVQSSNVDIGAGILDWNDSNVKTSSIFKLQNFGVGSDYWLMTDFSNGGVCYPTAATNILWYWGHGRNRSSIMNKVSSYSSNKAKATAIYNTLSANMMTTNNGTFDFMIKYGFSGFFNAEAKDGGVWNYKKLSGSAPYADYKTALNGQCPVFLVLKGSSNILTTNGHGVFTLGYATSYNGDDYLFVMDGWNRYGRFVKFDYYPAHFGYKIWVK